MIVTRDDLTAALAMRPVPFEACGLAVHLKPMTGGERLAFLRDHKADNGARFFARAVVYGLCDAAGVRLYGPDELDAADALDGKFAEAVALRFVDLNGLGDDGPKA